jgi:hypothetical protein
MYEGANVLTSDARLKAGREFDVYEIVARFGPCMSFLVEMGAESIFRGLVKVFKLVLDSSAIMNTK